MSRASRRSMAWLLLLLGCMPIAGCRLQSEVQKVQGHLLTFYTHPAPLRLGEVLAAIRVQDRDYRILSNYQGDLTVIESSSHRAQTVPLKSGLGRDLRAWVPITRRGHYVFQFHLRAPDGQSFSAQFETKTSRR